MADRPFPATDAYEGFAQHENGIGMARTFADEVEPRSPATRSPASGRVPGSSRRSTARRAEGYRAPRDVVARRLAAARRARPARPSCVLDRRVRRARARTARSTRSATLAGAEVRLPPVREPLLRRQHRASPACSTGEDVAAALAELRRRRPRACSPTSCSPRTASSTARASPTCPARSRSSRTDGASLVAALRPAARRPDGRAAPVVAVVGRPNVGKSTLVNRFVGRREAIVQEQPGVTRDRKELVAEWNGRSFLVVDTGGWIADRRAARPKQVSLQAERAIREADVVLHVVDVTVGATEEDAQVARDPAARRHAGARSWRTRPTTTGASARSGRSRSSVSATRTRCRRSTGGGAATCSTRWWRCCRRPDPSRAGDRRRRPRPFSVAIVGRPNVGKSTLFNRLVGDDRSVVHDMPGTTRDTIDTIVETHDGVIRFVDTAGMRRRSRVDEADRVLLGAARARRGRPSPTPRCS